MIDRKKVIDGLEYCMKRLQNEKIHCGECPYWYDDFESGCHILDLFRDASYLLKKEETKIIGSEK